MKKRILLAAAIVGLWTIGNPPAAEAMATCKYVPSLCPDPSEQGQTTGGSDAVSVPEPGVLVLLGTGVLAAGAAAIRRRRSSRRR